MQRKSLSSTEIQRQFIKHKIFNGNYQILETELAKDS